MMSETDEVSKIEHMGLRCLGPQSVPSPASSPVSNFNRGVE